MLDVRAVCDLCGDVAAPLSQDRCDRCWELEARIQMNAVLAANIVKMIEEGRAANDPRFQAERLFLAAARALARVGIFTADELGREVRNDFETAYRNLLKAERDADK